MLQIQLLGVNVSQLTAPIKAHCYFIVWLANAFESLYSYSWSFIGCCEFPSEVGNVFILTRTVCN